LIEGVVVVRILEKDSHLLVLLEVCKVFYEVRLFEGEIDIFFPLTPGPNIFQFIFKEGGNLSFVEVTEWEL